METVVEEYLNNKIQAKSLSIYLILRVQNLLKYFGKCTVDYLRRKLLGHSPFGHNILYTLFILYIDEFYILKTCKEFLYLYSV